MPPIEILSVGDELLYGQTVDTNANWIAQQVFNLGLQVRHVQTAGDRAEDIQHAVRLAASRSRLVIVTGGLGPTVDDLTLEAAAQVFGQQLVLHQDWADRMRQMFEAIGRPYSTNNEKQAWLPEHGALLPNTNGTAPGCRVDHGSATFFFFPGVPREMKPMFEAEVVPWIRANLSAPPFLLQKYRVFGVPESTLENRIKPLLGALPEPDRAHAALAYRVDFPEIEVKLVCHAPEMESNRRIIEDFTPGMQSILGEHLLSTEGRGLAELVPEALATYGLKIAVAESCTGGLLGKILTDRPGSSAYFRGGVMTYANDLKRDWLGVLEDDLNREGAVSAPVVEQMARDVMRLAQSHLAIAISGVAGPDGGSADKPVGTVFIGMADGKGARSRRYQFPGDRAWVRSFSAYSALFAIHRYIRHGRSLDAALG